MSITEAEPGSLVRAAPNPGFPFSDGELHQHVLARVLYEETEDIHLAGISAVEEGGAALLDYVIDVEGRQHNPTRDRKVGMVVVREFTPVTLRRVETPKDILDTIASMDDINRLRWVNTLRWTPASAVIGVMKGKRALIAGHKV